jgi:transglutaminase-like putative cysteine protease
MVPRSLRVAVALLVLDGLAALYLAELAGPALALAVGALVLAGSWVAGTRPALRPALDHVLVPAATLASLVDVLFLAEVVLDGLVRFLLFLVCYKLLTLRAVREVRAVAILAFGMMVAATSSAFGVGFLFVLIAFVGILTWTLLRAEQAFVEEPGPGRTPVGGDPGPGAVRGLTGLAVAATLAAVLVTTVFFFVIPRVGLAALPFRLKTGPMLTGFSDRVELGAYGEIETDSTVIMRVHVPQWTPEPARIPGLRWRGVALDRFDGRAWAVGNPDPVEVQRPNGDFLLGQPRGTGRILVQDVYLEPLGTPVIFAAPRVLSLRLRAGDTLVLDDMGSLSLPTARARLRYTVVSEVERVPPVRPPRRAPGPLDAEAAARYLQLPPLPERVAELARRLTAGAAGPHEAAVRLSEHLAREYRYTLLLDRRTALDPVDEFLFVRRSGNCEYFAAALAVMLRSVGIPARVVNGFQRGEWNPYGHYFMVRLRDAHSWVEAYVAGLGWVSLDPTPRAEAELGGRWAEAMLWLDALRMRWHRYVVNWSLRDQINTAWAIRQMVRQPQPWLGVPWPERRLVVALVLAAGGAAWLVVRLGRRRAGPTGRAARRLPPFYAAALRRLARRGFRPAPHETAREFAGRVAAAAPEWATPLTRLTVAYERVRFGAAPPEDGGGPDLDACLTALDRPAPR